MVALIHTWRKNPLVEMAARMAQVADIALEVEAIRRHVFVPAIAVKMYDAPYRCWEELDEIGQWEDDGGRNARP